MVSHSDLLLIRTTLAPAGRSGGSLIIRRSGRPPTARQPVARRDLPALADLRAGRLRVLHPGSFRDDPTRLIRLCRYGGRLGFAIEDSTRKLIDAALAAGALATVSGERIGRELRLAAAEPQPETLQVLAATGVAHAILGEVLEDWDVLVAALALCPPDGRSDLLVLAAVTVGQESAELATRLRRLAFTRDEADRVVRVAATAPAIAEALAATPAAAPSQVVAWLANEPVEAVALAGALARSPDVVATVQRYLGDLRHVRALLSGHDLAEAGLRGPEVGRGLDAALAVALDRPGAGREEQLAAALAATGHSSRPDD